MAWDADVESDQSDNQGESASPVSWLTVDEDRINVVFSLLNAEGRYMPDDSRPSMIWERPGG